MMTDSEKRTMRIGTVLLAAAVAGVLVSCPAPLDGDYLLEAQDATAPVVTVASPTDNTTYSETVVVSGEVADEAGGVPGEIQSLVYRVNTTLLTGAATAATVDSDGGFSFSFSTASYDGDLSVVLTATDWNDNAGSATVTLKDPGNDIPSFTAESSSQKITLTWSPTSDVVQYDLIYTDTGTEPSLNYGTVVEDIDTPYELSGLDNGKMHVLQLVARLTADASSASEIRLSGLQYAIPLSDLTLLPLANPGVDGISVSWPEIDGTEQFNVFRSEGESGEPLNITGNYTGNTLLDTNVTVGTTYYYSVKPALTGSTLSAARGVKPIPSGGTAFRRASSTTLENNTAALAIEYQFPHVYALGSDTLKTIAYENSGDPVEVDELSLTGAGVSAVDLVLAGGNLAVAKSVAGTDELEVLSLASGGVPATVAGGTTTFTDNDGGSDVTIKSLAAYENNAIVMAYADGVYLVDISTASSPSVDDTLGATDISPRYGAVNGDFLYVAAGTATEYKFDIYDLPGLTDVYSAGSGYQSVMGMGDPGLRGIVAAGTNLYVPNDSEGFIRVDIQSTTAPDFNGGTKDVDVSTTGSSEFPGRFTYNSTGLSYIPRAGRIIPADLTVANDPIYYMGGFLAAGGTEINELLQPSGGSTVFAAAGTSGVVEIDVSGVYNPAVSTGVATASGIASLALYGDNLYAGFSDGLIAIYDVSTPGTVTQLTTFDVDDTETDPVEAIGAAGDLIFIGTGNFVYIMQVVSGGLIEVGFVGDMGEVKELLQYGEYLLIAQGAGLTVVNIADPTNAATLGTVEISSSDPQGLAVNWPYVYVAAGSEGVVPVSLANPAVPRALSEAGVTGDAKDVALFDDYLAVANATLGVDFLDISEARSPVEIDNGQNADVERPLNDGVAGDVSDDEANVIKILTGGATAVAIDASGYVWRVDVTDPQYPTVVGRTAIADPNTAVRSGRYVYVGTDGGISVVDLLSED